MSKGIHRNNIPKLVLAGMVKAEKAWDALHGTWADHAPEYWFTVIVAQHLQRYLDTEKNWIGLEANVKETLKLAEVSRPGRPNKSLRHNGRCDIVVARGNEKPFAAIELKSPMYSFTAPLKKDIVRLRDMLRKDQRNSLSIACIALYSSASEENTKKGAMGTLEQRFENNLRGVRELCKDNALIAKEIHVIRVGRDAEDCWGVQCLFIVRK